MEQKEFANRLTQLRMEKGVSSRDMSLSLGLSESYINKIENGNHFPSMPVFFYICEYFNITPQEFFDTGNVSPQLTKTLTEYTKGLSREQLETLVNVAKGFHRD